MEFPKHLVKFKMIEIPDGSIEYGGKLCEVKRLAISETEIPWEVFEIWALRLDESVEQQTTDPQSRGVDAVSRPSRPYAVILTGFGYHGYPAMCVSSHSAQEFCKWLSAKTGKKFRLPSVAEWQYAARATNASPTTLDALAWTWENAEDATHKVGTKQANAWGLKDTLGNVAEWAVDDEGIAVACGGSFRDKASLIGASFVVPSDPKWNEADPQNPKSKWWLANGQHIGFRVVCEMAK